MAIIVSQNGKNAQKIDESGFPLENNLQEYIYDNPESIPLYDISEDLSLLILARELQTTSGPIDALGVDMFGNIYVVETKLYKNADKRQVVAQAIDYGAALWKHTNFERMVEQLDAKCRKQFGLSVSEKMTEYFGEGNTDGILTAMETNLTSGAIKFVILMDSLEDRLKDLVLYVNQNSQFDIYAVEMKYYTHETFEILIPAIYGAEVKKSVKSTSSNMGGSWQPSDEQSFLDELRRNTQSNTIVTFEQALRIHNLNKRLVEKVGGEIDYSLSPAKTARNIKMFIMLDGSISYALDSRSEQSFYLYKKQNPQVALYRSLVNGIIDNGLFDKDESLRDKSRLFVTVNSIHSTEDVHRFIEMFERELE